jgi:uncharacterized protein YprB with RNaseH-like and TPR domain/predicted nuclease with RNAse H fold/dephospho-CoA kinase
MLQHTFCHLPGISVKKEQFFWRTGVTTWDDLEHVLKPQRTLFQDPTGQSRILTEIELSRRAYESRNAGYFAVRLPRPEQYRIACSLPDSLLFLDIETTGLSRYYDYITLIGASKGERYKVFLKDSDPTELFDWMRESPVIVTFNGALFDVPFVLERYPNAPIPAAHIDLRFLARRAGLSGGQKELEGRLKIKRPKYIEDIRGEAAPILWHRFRRGDSDALRRLIEYNHSDIEGMKHILEAVLPRLTKKAKIPKALTQPGAVRTCFSKTDWTEIDGLIAHAAADNAGKTHIARITIDHLVRTEEGPRLRVVGIDLTGSEARPSGWCLLDGKNVITAQVHADSDLIARTIAAKPHLVSIDSPLSLPKGRISVDDENHDAGIMRHCERLLKRRGVNVYPALIPSMKRLTARGIAMADAFRKAGIPVIESYPGAAQDIMNIPRKRAGIEFLEMGLAEFGVAGPFLKAPVSHDELDAITSAIVGAFFWSGKYESLGEEQYGDEALIIPDLKVDATEWKSRRVVGISGGLAAGKTTLARAFERKGFAYGRYSMVIEAIVRAGGGGTPTRGVLQAEGERVHKQLGQRWLGRQLLNALPKRGNIVIDGLRFPEDHAFLTEAFGPGFVHIFLEAPEDERRRRYVERGGSCAEFDTACRHDVESKVQELSNTAHLVVNGSRPTEEVISEALATALGRIP